MQNIFTVDSLTKYLAIIITMMVCLTRLTMAGGEILYGIAVLIGSILWYKQRHFVLLTGDAKKYSIAVLVFFACTLPGALFTGDVLLGLKNFFGMWVYRYLVFVLILAFIKKREYLVYMLAVFLAVTCLDSLVALAQLVFHIDGVDRGWGFGSHKLTLASILAMLLPMMLVIIFDNHFEPILKKISKISVVCMFLGLMAGKSRGAWLTDIVTIPIAVFWYIRHSIKKLAIILLLFIAFAAIVGLSQTYQQRFESITNITTDRSNGDRIWVYRSCIDMAIDHPLTGIGLGQFKRHYSTEYKYPEETQDLPHGHNNFLHVLGENGLPGLLGLIYFTGYFLIKSLKRWKKDMNPYDLLICTTVLAYVCLFGQIEYVLDNSSAIRIFWFLLAILLQMRIIEEKQ